MNEDIVKNNATVNDGRLYRDCHNIRRRFSSMSGIESWRIHVHAMSVMNSITICSPADDIISPVADVVLNSK